jgi:hypothetical protein
MRRFRSAITGRFVRKAAARRHPKTSVTEMVSDAPSLIANLRWRVGDLETALVGAGAALERASRALSPASAGEYDQQEQAELASSSAEAARIVAEDRIPGETA